MEGVAFLVLLLSVSSLVSVVLSVSFTVVDVNDVNVNVTVGPVVRVSGNGTSNVSEILQNLFEQQQQKPPQPYTVIANKSPRFSTLTALTPVPYYDVMLAIDESSCSVFGVSFQNVSILVPVLGNGTCASTDGSSLNSATALNKPSAICINRNNTFGFILSNGDFTVRKFFLTDTSSSSSSLSLSSWLFGFVLSTTHASGRPSNGTTYQVGAANSSLFGPMTSCSIDDNDEFVFIADATNHVITQMNVITGLTTKIGLGVVGGVDGFFSSLTPTASTNVNLTVDASFNCPWGLAYSNNILFVTDIGNNNIRLLNLTSHTVSTWGVLSMSPPPSPSPSTASLSTSTCTSLLQEGLRAPIIVNGNNKLGDVIWSSPYDHSILFSLWIQNLTPLPQFMTVIAGNQQNSIVDGPLSLNSVSVVTALCLFRLQLNSSSSTSSAFLMSAPSPQRFLLIFGDGSSNAVVRQLEITQQATDPSSLGFREYYKCLDQSGDNSIGAHANALLCLDACIAAAQSQLQSSSSSSSSSSGNGPIVSCWFLDGTNGFPLDCRTCVGPPILNVYSNDWTRSIVIAQPTSSSAPSFSSSLSVVSSSSHPLSSSALPSSSSSLSLSPLFCGPLTCTSFSSSSSLSSSSLSMSTSFFLEPFLLNPNSTSVCQSSSLSPSIAYSCTFPPSFLSSHVHYSLASSLSSSFASFPFFCGVNGVWLSYSLPCTSMISNSSSSSSTSNSSIMVNGGTNATALPCVSVSVMFILVNVNVTLLSLASSSSSSSSSSLSSSLPSLTQLTSFMSKTIQTVLNIPLLSFHLNVTINSTNIDAFLTNYTVLTTFIPLPASSPSSSSSSSSTSTSTSSSSSCLSPSPSVVSSAFLFQLTQATSVTNVLFVASLGVDVKATQVTVTTINQPPAANQGFTYQPATAIADMLDISPTILYFIVGIVLLFLFSLVLINVISYPDSTPFAAASSMVSLAMTTTSATWIIALFQYSNMNPDDQLFFWVSRIAAGGFFVSCICNISSGIASLRSEYGLSLLLAGSMTASNFGLSSSSSSFASNRNLDTVVDDSEDRKTTELSHVSIATFTWLDSHRVFVAFILVLCIADASLLLLLCSRLCDFSCLSAPFSPLLRRRIVLTSTVSVLCVNAVYVTTTVLLITLRIASGSNLLTYLTLCLSLVIMFVKLTRIIVHLCFPSFCVRHSTSTSQRKGHRGSINMSMATQSTDNYAPNPLANNEQKTVTC